MLAYQHFIVAVNILLRSCTKGRNGGKHVSDVMHTGTQLGELTKLTSPGPLGEHGRG